MTNATRSLEQGKRSVRHRDRRYKDARYSSCASPASQLLERLASLDLAVVTFDGLHRVTHLSEEAASLLEASPTDIGRPLAELRWTIDGATLEERLEAVSLTSHRSDSDIQDRHGRWFHLQVCRARPALGGLDGFVAFFVDVNARAVNADLTKRALLEAEAASENNERFLATLSHELRGPLATVLTTATTLQRGGVEGAALQRIGQRLERSALQQQRLIEDVLDSTRLRTGGLTLSCSAVDFGELVKATVEDHRPTLEQRNLVLDLSIAEHESQVVTGDADRLVQVVNNLLDNAIKFTPPNGRIKVTLACVGPVLRLAVENTGKGIAASFLPRMFDRHAQEDHRGGARGAGVGLGLSIVRQLVQAHGGSVSASSAGDGSGAELSVYLPLRSALPASWQG